MGGLLLFLPVRVFNGGFIWKHFFSCLIFETGSGFSHQIELFFRLTFLRIETLRMLEIMCMDGKFFVT